MKRNRNNDVAVVGRKGQRRSEKFGDSFAERLVKSVLVPSDERGQRASMVFVGRSITCERARGRECRWRTQASRASTVTAPRRTYRHAANLAYGPRERLQPSKALLAHMAMRVETESRTAHRASGRVKKIQHLRCERHIKYIVRRAAGLKSRPSGERVLKSGARLWSEGQTLGPPLWYREAHGRAA